MEEERAMTSGQVSLVAGLFYDQARYPMYGVETGVVRCLRSTLRLSAYRLGCPILLFLTDIIASPLCG